MCSVVGYIGNGQSRSVIMEGLSRLEYRGYDSAGFACVEKSTRQLLCKKTSGRLSSLADLLADHPIDGMVGIGHTRWATHGIASSENAHPHFDCFEKIAVVHNGIIENYHDLKIALQDQGHNFRSETDTEVVAHLFEQALALHENSYENAVLEVTGQLRGAYAFIIIMQDYPDVLIAVRKGSPLCLGIGCDEMLIASDVLAFAGRVDRVAFLPDETVAFVRKQCVKMVNFQGSSIDVAVQPLDALWKVTDKGDHEHYMLKEIYEQRGAIYRTVTEAPGLGVPLWNKNGHSLSAKGLVSFENIQRIKIIGCGTSWHAGRIGEFFFEEIAGIPTTAALASEFRYRTFFPEAGTLYIVVSQSGETADSLEVVRFLKARGFPVVALTNVASSTLVRESAGYFLTQAGPEMAVASTKAFTTQVAALYFLAQRIAFEQKKITLLEYEAGKEKMYVAAELLQDGLDRYKQFIFETVAPFYSSFESFIFLGRHITYPFALEAALKLKEIAYIFSQAYPAGELKHGPLALVDSKTPVCIFSHPDPIMYQKILSGAQETKARGGIILSFTFAGQSELQAMSEHSFVFPTLTPHLSVIAIAGVTQLLMYAIAKERGCDIDRPRNLAKSVTVE